MSTHRTTLVIPPDLKAKIVARAEQEHRSMANLILHAVEVYLAGQEAKQEGPRHSATPPADLEQAKPRKGRAEVIRAGTGEVVDLEASAPTAQQVPTPRTAADAMAQGGSDLRVRTGPYGGAARPA